MSAPNAFRFLVPGVDAHGYDPDFSPVLVIAHENNSGTILVNAKNRDDVTITSCVDKFDVNPHGYILKSNRHSMGDTVCKPCQADPFHVGEEVRSNLVKILTLRNQLRLLEHAVYDSLVPYIAPLTTLEIETLKHDSNWKPVTREMVIADRRKNHQQQ